MLWDILSQGVRKNPSEDVPKNLVFHVHCRIKSINFCLVIWFDISEVIWLLFKTRMKHDFMQSKLYLCFKTPCKSPNYYSWNEELQYTSTTKIDIIDWNLSILYNPTSFIIKENIKYICYIEITFLPFLCSYVFC